jgi:molybdopterin converting factor small subunit
VPVLRLFAQARQAAAGAGRIELEASTVGQVLDQARARFGPEFSAVVDASRIWCNGEPASDDQPVGPGDEVAVLPPVSGG